MFRLLVALILPVWTMAAIADTRLRWGLATGLALLSFLLFGLYGWDKRRARSGGRRVPERTLHVLALLGGWPGAIAGQACFRHKTSKPRFQLLTWMWVLVHQLIYASWLLRRHLQEWFERVIL